MTSLRIAVIGARGVPATFGGIERHVEELGSRLVARGHDVTVYSRSNYVPAGIESYRGMRVRRLPAVGTKHLDAISHSALSTLHAMPQNYDVIHFHALGPGLLSPLPRTLRSTAVVQTVHGLDDDRAKWGGVAKRVLLTAGWMSARVPDATVVVSEALKDHYQDRRKCNAFHINNGVNAAVHRPARRIVDELGLEPQRYILFVGRFVPEKAPDVLMRAFQLVPHDVKLVLAGGSSFTDDYTAELQRLAAEDDRVVLPGYVYGELLEELYANAAAFCLPSYLEGLPLTLLEAASYGLPLIGSDIAPNLQIMGPDGSGRRLTRAGDVAGLAKALTTVLDDQHLEAAGSHKLAPDLMRMYSWDHAAEQTENVYYEALATVSQGRGRRRAARS